MQKLRNNALFRKGWLGLPLHGTHTALTTDVDVTGVAN